MLLLLLGSFAVVASRLWRTCSSARPNKAMKRKAGHAPPALAQVHPTQMDLCQKCVSDATERGMSKITASAYRRARSVALGDCEYAAPSLATACQP